MRVTHVVCSTGFAGVERYLAYTLPALARSGVEVRLVGGPEAEMSAALDGSTVAWYPGADLPGAVRSLVRLDSDIVHAHMTSAEAAAAVTTALRGTRLVTTRHFAQRRGSSRLARAAGVVLGRVIDRELAISQFVADRVGVATTVVPNGVPDAPAGNHTARTVLVAQRFEAEKHTDVALRAWRESALADDGWRLIVAGQGAERPRLERLAADLGVQDSTDFVGFRSDIQELMADAGILLATAPEEPFGLTVVEAMACGLPVVGAAGGAHVETVGAVIPESLFQPGSPADAARRLVRLACNEDLRSAEGARLRDYQQTHFSVTSHVERLLAVYREVLQF